MDGMIIMLINFIIGVLIGVLIGYNCGYIKGKKTGYIKGIKIAPLIIKEDSLKEGHCLICNKYK